MDDNPSLDAGLVEKLAALRETLEGYESLAVAFSGGVDSALLLAVAHDALRDRVVAVTGRSPSIPPREVEAARAFCQERGIDHAVVDTHEFDIEGFKHNPPDRCYRCKRELFACVAREADRRGINAVAEGSNIDDEGDYRPGFRAVAEMRVESPLRDAGLRKADVRAIARHLGLPQWDKPAFACLNSRFAYGDSITSELLAMADGAEEALRSLGFRQVRVRMSGKSARIEVPPDDIGQLVLGDIREKIVRELEALGFAFVSVDLRGYRTGSMNATLPQADPRPDEGNRHVL